MRAQSRRIVLLCSLCLAAVAMGHAPAEERFEPDRPVRTSLRIEGRSTPLRGEIRQWAFGAFWVQRQGSDIALEIPWSDLQPKAVYETTRGMLGRDDADGYFRLGIEMLRLGDERLADRAFRFAQRQDGSLGEHIERAQSIHGDGGDPRDAYAEMIGSRESGAAGGAVDGGHLPPPMEDDAGAIKGATPWPALGAEAREQAIIDQREYVRTAGFERGDPERRIHETDHFIVAADMSERDLRRWSATLETMYETMLETLELPKETDLYAGKCMVFLFNSRDSFMKFERVAMGIDASRFGGLCHQRGNNVILSFYRWGSDTEFQSVLVHESVHGVMYRYRTPAALPTWANEGLADYIAGRLTPESQEPREHWTHVKAAIARGLDPMSIMEQSYRDGSWFTQDSYPTSHMLVRFLIKYKPREFKQWIDLIKAGKPWEGAMGEAFGIDADMLARGFVDEIRSETTYRAH